MKQLEKRILRFALFVGISAASVQAQASSDSIRIVSAGPRNSGADILRTILAANPEIIRSDTGVITLPRGDRRNRTIVIFAEGARVASAVAGDVVVVGGDLFVHPGASIGGRAVAIGGGVFVSTLASVRGERRAFRDGTFIWSDVPGGIALDYRPLVEPYAPPFFSLPFVYGVRLPVYDRVDGVSLTWGPLIQPSRAIGVDPAITYRSHRGVLDPALRVDVDMGNGWRSQALAGRETRTNEGWIRGPISNSIASLLSGSDARNYYRARVIEGTVSREFEIVGGRVEAQVGAMHERASTAIRPVAPVSSGALVAPRRRPWSLRGRDEEGIARPNPFVPDDRISSALAGFKAELERAGIASKLDARLEVPWEVMSGARFTQLTLDGRIGFPTFGNQRFQMEAHWMTTLNDTAPPQRWSYLGGSGTLPTFELLQFGGDELFFLESRYVVPVNLFVLPLLGSPTIALRHMVGAAGIGRLPALEQNLALRAQVGFFRAEYVIDPRTRDHDFDIGFTLSR